MAQEYQPSDTLVPISGTLAGIDLALVGILSAKSAISHTQTIADDLFMFSALGFLVVLSVSYWSQKKRSAAGAKRLIAIAERIFALALILLLVAGFVLVYTEL